MGILDEIRKSISDQPNIKLSGKLWVNMLIDYSVENGKSKAEIIRCFTSPAKDSEIKFKRKKKSPYIGKIPNIETVIPETEPEYLF